MRLNRVENKRLNRHGITLLNVERIKKNRKKNSFENTKQVLEENRISKKRQHAHCKQKDLKIAKGNFKLSMERF